MKITKTIPFFISLLFFTQCNTDKSNKNILVFPKEWSGKVIEFPLEFAPSIQYSGTEFTRFAPKYDHVETTDYFSYIFLWKINENPSLSPKKMESLLEIYFDGLITNQLKKNTPITSQIPKTKAFFERVNDSTYIGKVLTFDVLYAKKAITLNVMVNYRNCSKENKHLLLFKLSPQHLDHQIWKKLRKIDDKQICI